MKIEQLILKYQKKGVELFAKDGKLKFIAPHNVIGQEEKAELKNSKQAILEFLSTHNETQIIQDTDRRYEPFDLTDIQMAYMIGQKNTYNYGGTGCKIYSEFEIPNVDIIRLQKAWESVVLRNDMLHAVIEKSGQQRILKEYIVPQIKSDNLICSSSEIVEKVLAEKRIRLSEKQYEIGTWPLFDLEVSILPDKCILHLSLDMLIADFVSIQILLRNLEESYYDKVYNKGMELSYRDIVIYQNNSKKTVAGRKKYEEDKLYWEKRIELLPEAPELPVIQKEINESVKFEQYNLFLDSEQYGRLLDLAQKEKATVSTIILTAYTEVLRLWSRNQSFCINMTMANRPFIHPDIYNVIGDFTVIDVLEVKYTAGKNFLEKVQILQAQLWNDLSHIDFSGVEVIRAWGKKKKREVIVPIVYTSTIGASSQEKSAWKLLYKISRTPQVLIDCQVMELNGGILVNWDVRNGVFPEGMIEDAFISFKNLLNAVANCELDLLCDKIVELPEKTKLKRLKTNQTNMIFPSRMLQDGFYEHLKKTPDAPALYSDGIIYTYKEIERYVVSIQKELSKHGFCHGNIVAIALKKGIWQIAGVLATLCIGGVYLPIDIHQPIKRIERIIKNSGAKYCLCNNDIKIDNICTCINTNKMLLDENEKLKICVQDVKAAAYIIYTSGSTGEPKGVIISHEAAVNTILDINDRFSVNSSDRILNVANLSFDLSVYDIFGAFFAGGMIVQILEDKNKSPEHWLDVINKQKITICNLVPAQMKMLMLYLNNKEYRNNNLRLSLLSGDWIPVDLPAEIKHYFPQISVISLGGATECSIWSIYYPIDTKKKYIRSIPYGKPLANQEFYILNECLEEVPDCVIADIYIAGKGLAIGYLNDVTLTQKKFIYHEKLNKRLYKTGDKGCYLGDGNIEFFGREDNQVKIRGHRIELGEIEASVKDEIKSSAVKAIVTNQGNSKIICVFISCLDSGIVKEINKDELNSKLKEKLPNYMLPSEYILINQMPLTQNGKIDIGALNEIIKNNTHNTQEKCIDSNLTDMQKVLKEICCNIFNIHNIDIDDDFFEIGGDSVTVIKLINEIEKETGYKIEIEDVFSESTIRQLSVILEKGRRKI